MSAWTISNFKSDQSDGDIDVKRFSLKNVCPRTENKFSRSSHAILIDSKTDIFGNILKSTNSFEEILLALT